MAAGFAGVGSAGNICCFIFHFSGWLKKNILRKDALRVVGVKLSARAASPAWWLPEDILNYRFVQCNPLF
jgi:hypothetical protein